MVLPNATKEVPEALLSLISHGAGMDKTDQAFWQVFHAAEAKMAASNPIDALSPQLPGDMPVTVELDGLVHAWGILRREADRRNMTCADLVAIMSEERKSDLPAWWLVLAADRAIGVLPESHEPSRQRS